MAGYRKAAVYVQGIMAGILRETEDGYEFAYDTEYVASENAVAVSLTMPLENEKYEDKVLMPFFDGLIPEGWLLSIVCDNWKINRNDRMGLLLVTCRDCIGDVSIREVSDDNR